MYNFVTIFNILIIYIWRRHLYLNNWHASEKKNHEVMHWKKEPFKKRIPVVLQMNVQTSKTVRLITNHLLWWFLVVNALYFIIHEKKGNTIAPYLYQNEMGERNRWTRDWYRSKLVNIIKRRKTNWIRDLLVIWRDTWSQTREIFLPLYPHLQL